MHRALTFAVIALLLPDVGQAQQPHLSNVLTMSAEDAANTISSDDIRRRIGIIAHDSMRGRETPSPELEEVADYIAAEFEAFGLRPGGEAGGFLQRYPLQRVRLDLAASGVTVRGGATWRVGTDVVRHIGLTPPTGVSGPTVVVSGRPAGLADMAELPVAGAVVLVAATLDRSTNLVVRGAREQGAAAVLMITPRPEGRWRSLLRAQRRERAAKGWEREPSGAPILEMRDSTIAPILRAHGFDLAAARGRRDAPVTATRLPNLALTVTLQDQVVSKFTAPNVVGFLEGSDPALKNEYIVFSAHMDHVGTRRPVGGDSIYNGADDNASGTVGIIELAEAFAQLEPRPRRSLIFLTVSGEEKGLWGSEYFTVRPPVPTDRIVANLNADMIGRNWPDTIVVIGQEHSDLGQTLVRVNAAHPELNMTAIADLWPQENFYRRSDHFNFARRGVPILFFFNGTHDDYHRPSDHVELIDAEKESRIVRLMFFLGLEIANAADRPQWDPTSYEQIVDRGSSE